MVGLRRVRVRSRGWCEPAVLNICERARGLQFDDGRDGFGVGELLVVVVVGRVAGGVVDPPGGLEGDAVGVGEVDGADGAVVYDVGDFAVGGLEASLQGVEGCFVGHVEGQMVELGARGSGRPAGLAKGSMGVSAYWKKATVQCGPNSKK